MFDIQLGICWSKGSERGVISPHPWGEPVLLWSPATLLCNLLRASSWRPWQKGHQLVDIKLCHIKCKALGDRAQRYCWEGCQLLQGAGWEGSKLTARVLGASRCEVPSSAHPSSQSGCSKPWAILCDPFSFLLCRQRGTVQGIVAKNQTGMSFSCWRGFDDW